MKTILPLLKNAIKSLLVIVFVVAAAFKSNAQSELIFNDWDTETGSGGNVNDVYRFHNVLAESLSRA